MKKKVENRLPRFWQELKRRNVVRVITIYAAVAFVILELVSIIVEPLRLPDWTLPLIIVLLFVGFVIAVILSWIYDMTPQGIEKTGPAKEPEEETTGRRSGALGWKIATILSLAVIVALVAWNILKSTQRSTDNLNLEKSIAVLPFHYYNIDPEAEDIGDAFSNEIITQLYKIRGFDRIISHTSTLRYKGSDMPSIQVIGNELNANFIIEGSLERQDEEVSIQVQIVRAIDDNHIWADEFKGRWENIFEIRASIAKNIASELKTILTRQEIEQIEKQPTDNLKAYDFYLLGNQYQQRRTEETLLKAIDLYKSAIDLDPDFALAWVGIGESYMSLFWFANWFPEEAYGKAKEAIQKALAINDQLAEAHLSLSTIKLEHDWDFEGTENEINRAITLNPNLAVAYADLSELQCLRGDYQSSHSNMKKALALDPNSMELQNRLGYTYYLVGQIDSAVIHLQERIGQYPGDPVAHYYLGYIYLEIGDYQKAISELEAALEPDSVIQHYRMYLGIACARAGMPDQTMTHLEFFDLYDEEYRTVSFGRAALLAELGEVDSSLFWLERAIEERYQHVLYIKPVKVLFSSMRSDPRFIEIYQQIYPEDQ